MQYLFTVILPVYQVADYLEQCLDSLVNQCGDDVQILLVDDGSTDGSLELCRLYAEKNRFIQVIPQPNGGVSKARNTGLENAKGEYLLWVDPDDWVEPEWLSAIRRALRDSQPDMLIFDYSESENGRSIERPYLARSQRLSASQVLTDLTDDTRLRSVLWNKVIRRSFFEKQRFDETLRCMEDAEILCRIIPHMSRIDYLHQTLYVYRIRPTGLVQKPDLPSAFRCFEIAKKREECVSRFGAPVSPLGTWLQAKGFLCKYYRSGFPKNWDSQYRECREHLSAARHEIMHREDLGIKDRIKYLAIGHPAVGVGYRLAKNIKTKLGERHG